MIANERQVFAPPIGNTSGHDGQSEHAEPEVAQVGVHAREHVAKGALERGETHQEEHDT